MTSIHVRRLATTGLTGALVAVSTLTGLGAGSSAAHAAGPTGAEPTTRTAARTGTGPSSGHYTDKVATSRGTGGAVTSVDPEATKVGLGVLRRGGNAVDAAIATAAALGVTEPYSSGLGGGSYLVYYDAGSGRVHTLDGRETAPRSMPKDAFVDPTTGKPWTFSPDLVTSGVSVGTPGSPATWAAALHRWGTASLGKTLRPAERLARRGFVVDQTFRQQTLDNKVRFEAFTTTPELFLPGGDAPRIGSVLKNPDLARTYRLLGRQGIRAFYHGELADQIADLVQRPPKNPRTTLPVPPGYLHARDLADYRVVSHRPTHVRYRGYDVYGMAPSSSGGTTVGEALNIMERYDLHGLSAPAALHRYLEASALAFADRAAYVGDPDFVKVPVHDLLSDTFAKQRACAISRTKAFTPPVAAGEVADHDGTCATAAGSRAADTENRETTNLTVADRWGNVVEYTLTIEQTGGSGMLVPGRGFLLNNELTDFTTAYDPADPNRIQPGKRPRSSISPTIIFKDGRPFVALGSPGGSTIITTVLQMIFGRIDRDLSLPAAIAAPRASQRNTPDVSAEPAFITRYGPALEGYGHSLVVAGDGLTSSTEIGAATAIEFGRDGQLTAVAEPTRRGGGSALVVHPSR